METTRPNITNPTGYKCDWCGMSYPLGGWDYYQLVLFGKELKTICSDCYNHLQHITIDEQIDKRHLLNSKGSPSENSINKDLTEDCKQSSQIISFGNDFVKS